MTTNVLRMSFSNSLTSLFDDTPAERLQAAAERQKERELVTRIHDKPQHMSFRELQVARTRTN